MAIFKLYEGKTTQEVADELFVTPQIVQKWFHQWNEQGPDGLVDLPQPRRPSLLTKEERAELLQEVLKTP